MTQSMAQSLIKRTEIAHWRMILLRRPAAQQVNQPTPDHQVDNRAQNKTGRIQKVAGNLLQMFVGGHLPGLGPFVQVMNSDCQRNEQQQHQRQSLHPRFQDAANHQAPFPTRHVLQHEYRHAPQRQSQPGHVPEKIGMHELLRGRDENTDD